MKKVFIFLILHALIVFNTSTCLFAQNVGIGDPLPSAKLTISGNETTPNGQAASLKIINTASTNAWYLRAGATGTNTPANGFSIGDNANIHFNLLSNGNLGLGLIPQSARLHVNGAIKMEGTNFFEFGAGIAGKELNAGKIGYNAFGTTALEFVGAGTSTTDRRVYFFAEGGTTFSGSVGVLQNLNTNGLLQLNGNSGLAGQVLTSNGASAPTWTEAPLSNNDRFNVTFDQSFSGNAPLLLTTDYNFGGPDIVIVGNILQINKAGLYHFDLFAHYTHSAVSTINPVVSLSLENSTINFLWQEVVDKKTSGGIYKDNWDFSFDLYVPAGRNLRLVANLSDVTSFSFIRGNFSGHLISE